MSSWKQTDWVGSGIEARAAEYEVWTCVADSGAECSVSQQPDCTWDIFISGEDGESHAELRGYSSRMAAIEVAEQVARFL